MPSFLFHVFLFHVKTCCLHYPQCKQLKCQQFGQTFGCVVQSEAQAASLKQRWGAGYRSLLSSHLSNATPLDFFHFQTCSLQPQPRLPQVTSHEGIHQSLHSSFCSHKRLNTTFFTYTVALPKICQKTLMCKISEVPLLEKGCSQQCSEPSWNMI